MKCICKEIKPFIDTAYRTLPQRETTLVAGSSMGGLMRIYAVIKYNPVFSKATYLSPSLFQMKTKLQIEMDNLPQSPQTDMYISWGSDEFRSKNQLAKMHSYYLEITNNLLQRHMYVYPNLIFKGKYSEASWEKEILLFMKFLLTPSHKQYLVYSYEHIIKGRLYDTVFLLFILLTNLTKYLLAFF